MIAIVIEWIGTILFLIMGGISLSKKILKAKTQFYCNILTFSANTLYGILAIINQLYGMLVLEIAFTIMSFIGIIKFYRIYKKEER